MLHRIPDDGWPHAPTTECGCGPQLVAHKGGHALQHVDMCEPAVTTDPDPALDALVVDGGAPR